LAVEWAGGRWPLREGSLVVIAPNSSGSLSKNSGEVFV